MQNHLLTFSSNNGAFILSYYHNPYSQVFSIVMLSLPMHKIVVLVPWVSCLRQFEELFLAYWKEKESCLWWGQPMAHSNGKFLQFYYLIFQWLFHFMQKRERKTSCCHICLKGTSFHFFSLVEKNVLMQSTSMRYHNEGTTINIAGGLVW